MMKDKNKCIKYAQLVSLDWREFTEREKTLLDWGN